MSQCRIVYLVFGISILLSISGCDLLPEKIVIPTLMPEHEVPTAIALTAQALIDVNANAPGGAVQNSPPTPTPGAMSTSQSLETTRVPEQAPSPPVTPTPLLDTSKPSPTFALEDLSPDSLPESIPYGDIQILNPGPLSKVTSPFELHAYLFPGADDRVRVALYGEDGRLLTRKILRYSAPRDMRVHARLDLGFGIPGVAETARVEIVTHDAYGRIQARTSTDLILLAEGSQDINPPLDLYEKIVVEEPVPNALIQGGTMIVKGYTRFTETGQLLVEILDYRGNVVGSKVIGVSDKELERGYHFFAGEVPYQVSVATWVRVQVTARDDALSGVIHTSSVLVLISP